MPVGLRGPLLEKNAAALLHTVAVLLCTVAVQAGWKDGGVGRCQTVARQFGDPPPKGWAYDTQPGLSGSLAFNASVSLEIC